jgi:hypothetical protein
VKPEESKTLVQTIQHIIRDTLKWYPLCTRTSIAKDGRQSIVRIRRQRRQALPCSEHTHRGSIGLYVSAEYKFIRIKWHTGLSIQHDLS